MTLLRRESQPISEEQTIIRSHYLYQPPAIAGVQMPPTTVTKEVVVVGCGVNYDANRGVGQPRWVASNGSLVAAGRAGVAYESTAGPLEFSLPVASDQWLVVRKNGRAVSSRIVGAAAATAIKSDDRTARYLNVFPDTDLVWKVGNGYLKESLILRSRTAPTEFSFLLESRDFAFLASDASQSSFSLNEIRATAQATKVAGPLLLAPATAKQNHQILVPAPFVVDAHGKRSSLRCFVSRTPAGALLYTMRIPAGFLTARALTYPLTVDPSYYNVSDASITTFEAGKTYYIETAISYDDSENVRVEANAFLKFAPGSYLAFSGNAVIDVQGTPYNYAYFTSGYDDTVGADTDGPQGSGLPLLEDDPAPGDYACAIQLCSHREGSTAECAIQYAKFAYAGEAIVVNDPYEAAGPNLLVEHSIFRDNPVGVAIGIETPNVSRESAVNNCLFVGPTSISGSSVLLSNQSEETHHTLSLTNCTMDNFGAGLYIYPYDGPGLVFNVLRNVFSDTGLAVHCYAQLGDGGTYSIDYNGRCGTHEDYWSEPSDLDNIYEGDIDESGDPFVTNANGSYYLTAQTIFRNAGNISATAAGLSAKTTTAATGDRITTQNITTTKFWSLIQRDGDTPGDSVVDLGYHYDPVDIIIAPVNEPLNVTGIAGRVIGLPGITVAFSHAIGNPDGNGITAQNLGGIAFDGAGGKPIRFSSTLACGDNIGGGQLCPVVPGLTHLWLGLYVLETGFGRVSYCTFENTAYGVQIWNAMDPIVGCRFSGCIYGVYHAMAGEYPTTIKNCLFRDISEAGIASVSPWPLTIVNGTFHRAQSGIYFFSSGDRTVQNCIFTSNTWGICAYEAEPENHNCFYANTYNANFTLDQTDLFQDPKFDNATAGDLYSRFFLQESSPCVDAGDTSLLIARLADCTTWRTASADRGLVDIGYHYGPVCRGGYDSDSDGMDDQWEIFFFGSTTARSGTEDEDGDGVTTAQEYLFKSNPLVPDIAVRLYRDDAYSRPITDWDEWPGVNRQSPRFIFSQFDPIYIEIRGIQTASPTLTNEIKVVSESNPTGIYITLRQTSPGSGVFHSTDEPLCLAVVSYDPPAEGKHWIKIVDEEKLTFSFETIASGVTREVLVDLGEYAGCGIHELYGGSGAEDTLNRELGGKGHWFCAGDYDFPNNVGGGSLDNEMATFIRNAGGNYAYSLQADFLYMTAHGIRYPNNPIFGICDGELYGRAGHIFDPDHPDYGVRVTSEWNQDLEWVFVEGCYVLADAYRAPYRGWSTGLGGTPKRVHALLGNHELGGGDASLGKFWFRVDPAGHHMPIVEGYQIAQGHDIGVYWATYCIFSSRGDKLDEVTPDNDEANPWYVYEDSEPTSRSEHLYAGAGSEGGSLDGGTCREEVDLASIAGAGLKLPESVIARRAFPSLRDDFPIRDHSDVSPWGDVTHVGKWEIAGRRCPYTAEEAQAVAKAFAEKELPTIANRVRWRATSRLRWGMHRQTEPLALQTGGYSVADDLAYSDVPLLHDRVDITILGNTVECVSVTCHEIVQTATESLTVENCRAIVERALPEVKAVLSVGDIYAIPDARLVFAGSLDRGSDEARQDLVEYRPAWAVVFNLSPSHGDGTNTWTVFLDAASGEYLGHIRGWAR